MLVLHKLLARLEWAHADGRLRGMVTVVPQPNPLGIAQFRNGHILGRFHEATSRNFNRHFRLICRAATAGHDVRCVAESDRRSRGRRADVLDLHSDSEALPDIYGNRSFCPDARDLGGALEADVAILRDNDDDGAFEGAMVSHWLRERQIEGRVAATVKLRGQSDVSDELADWDAQGVYAFLCGWGVLEERGDQRALSSEVVPMV
ncbi:succinylglutamate desuccinylase/aspartoacylase family protein [Paraburkholderia sediminicola]|nr:succinylglutamate desuccinylase/aspartoacylase family protein [Paraburkholderia sediminicola]